MKSKLRHRCSPRGFGFLRFKKFWIFLTRVWKCDRVQTLRYYSPLQVLSPEGKLPAIYYISIEAPTLEGPFSAFENSVIFCKIKLRIHSIVKIYITICIFVSNGYFLMILKYLCLLTIDDGRSKYTLALNKSRNDQNSIHPKANIDLESHDED